MYDKDELEAIERGSTTPEEKSGGRVSRRIFVASIMSSFGMVMAFVVLMVLGSVAPAATFGQVGGIQVGIGEIRGSNVTIYPAVTESSNCIRNTNLENPTGATAQALPVLAADIGDARVPGEYQLLLQKDIRLPFGSNAMRVKVQRNESIAPDNVVSRSFYSGYSSPPTSVTYDPNGQFIREFNFGPDTFVPKVDDLREATAVDSDSGYRNITQAKIFAVKDQRYRFDLRVRGIDEADNFDIKDAGVRAFIDWNQNGNLGDQNNEVVDIGFLDDGDGSPRSSDDPNYENNGVGNLTATVNVPPGAPTGETLMRVVMEVGETPTNIGSGYSGTPTTFVSEGVVEEYTVAVVEDSSDVPEATRLADTTLKISDLSADFLDLRAPQQDSNFLVDDRYSGQPDPGVSPPVFTEDGELELSATSPGGGENVRIRNAEGILHFASFSSLDISFFEATVEVIDATKANLATDTCPVVESGFQPVITDVPDPGTINTGDTITVDADIINPGENSETQDVSFRIAGSTEDFRSSQTIPAFSTKSYDGTDEPAFTGQVPGTTGRYDVTVDPADDPPVSEEIIVGDPPNFQITINSATPDPVEAENSSNPLVVDYTITNTGSPNVGDTQRIELLFDGTVATTSNEFVAGANSVTRQFSIAPSDSAAGDPTNVTVASEDDFDNTDVTIYESPNFDVNITNTNEPVDAANESLIVDANITNIGEAKDTQEIKLDLVTGAGNVRNDVDNQTVTLDSTTTTDFQNIQLSYNVSPTQDAGPADVTVRSEDDDDTTEAFIQGADVFVINNFGVTPATADPTGETITANFDLENIGTEQGTQTAVLDIILNDGTVLSNVDNTGSVTLNAQQQQTGFSLSNVTQKGYYPEVDMRVSTDNDQKSRTVNIRQPPTFSIQDVRTQDPAVVEGEIADVEIDVRNNGGVSGTADLNLDIQIDGDPNNVQTVNSTSLSIAPGTTETVTLGWPTTASTVKSTNHVPVAEVFNQSSPSTPDDTGTGGTIAVGEASLRISDFRVLDSEIDVGSAGGANDNTVNAEIDIENTAGPNGPSLTANRVETLYDRNNDNTFGQSAPGTITSKSYSPGVTTETFSFDIGLINDPNAPISELDVRGELEDSGGTIENRDKTISTVNAPFFDITVNSITPRDDDPENPQIGNTGGGSTNVEDLDTSITIENTGSACGSVDQSGVDADVYIDNSGGQIYTDAWYVSRNAALCPGGSFTETNLVGGWDGDNEMDPENPSDISATVDMRDALLPSNYQTNLRTAPNTASTAMLRPEDFSYTSNGVTDGIAVADGNDGDNTLTISVDVTNNADVTDTTALDVDITGTASPGLASDIFSAGTSTATVSSGSTQNGVTVTYTADCGDYTGDADNANPNWDIEQDPGQPEISTAGTVNIDSGSFTIDAGTTDNKETEDPCG